MTAANLLAAANADELLAALCAKLPPEGVAAVVRAALPFIKGEDMAERRRRQARERSQRSYEKLHSVAARSHASASESHAQASEEQRQNLTLKRESFLGNGEKSHGEASEVSRFSDGAVSGKEAVSSPGPSPSEETSVHPKKDPTGPKKALPAPLPETVPLPDALADVPRFAPTWAQFIESRRLIKKPMTHLAAERLLASLAQRPLDAAAAVDMAIEKQWQGFNWNWFDRERAPLNDTGPPRHVNGHDSARPKRCL